MKNIKLLVFDIDGTLIPRGSEVLEESTKLAINECMAKGIKVMISTGRCSYLIQKDALKSIHSDYVVTINGALICDSNLNTLYINKMSEEVFNQILKEAIDLDIALAYKFEKHIVVYNKYQDYINTYVNGKEMPCILNYENKRDYHLNYGMPCGAFVIGDNDKLKTLASRVPSMTWVVAYDHGMECFNKCISKASGIKLVLDQLNLTFDNVMAFGDSQNDIEMLTDAAIGVAMGNATEETKKAADYITTASGDNGIYNALKHFNLIS